MKAFIIALVALVVIVFAASFVLDGETVASSDRYQAPDSVRLDPEMSSARPAGEVVEAEETAQ